MKFLRSLPVAILLLMAAMPASARQDGHQLYEGCQVAVAETANPDQRLDYTESYNLGYCYGVVQGVSESLKKNQFFCLPSGITFGALAEVVVDYLERYPAQRDLKATQAAYHSLLATFPCPRIKP